MSTSRFIQTIGFVLLIIGIILIGIGAFLIYHLRSKQISDKVYDTAVSNEIENIKAKAFERLNIDPYQVNLIPPIFLHQYTTDRIRMPLHWKFGKTDNKLRMSNIECMAMFFSEHQVYCYYEQFSMTYREDYIETKEYFYSDIDSMEITKANVRTDASDESGGKLARKNSQATAFSSIWEKFVISTISGSQFTLMSKRYVNNYNQNTKNNAFDRLSAAAEAEIMGIDKILRGVINLWRQKKIEN